MRIVLDFETANRAGVDLRVVGADVYAKHPATEILCAVLKFEDGSHFRWRPGDLIPCDITSVEWEAHNAAFEKAIWRAIMVPRYGFPDIPDERWHCSQATARYKGLPGGLDKLAKVLELVHQKDMAASRFTKKMSTPNKKTGEFDRSPESLQRVEDYCVTDTDAEAEAIAAIGSLSPYEREVWLLDQKINQRGVLLDAEYIAACIRIVDQETERLTAEFVALTGFNPTQRDKVLRWAQEQGAPISSLKASTLDNLFGSEESEDVGSGLDEDVQTLPNLPQPVLRALQIRRVLGSASIKKLRRMQLSAAPDDGRSRGLVEYHGAGTGRWAGRGWQPHNLVRGKVKLAHVDKEGNPTESPPWPHALKQCLLTGDADYVRMFFPDPLAAVASGLRHAVIPSPGCAFHSADFSGIEMRFVLAVAGQHDKCALLASGHDVYLDMACDIFGVPKGTFNKNDNVYERTLGKNTVLGCGFQMGGSTFYDRYCGDRSVEFATDVVQSYRKVWAPKVPKLWYALDDLALCAASDTTGRRYEHKDYRISYQRYSHGGRDWLVSILPDGQLMWYYNPQYADGRWSYQAMKLGQWRTIDAYGGLLTENYIQKLARGLLVTAMKLVEKAGYPVVLTVHDEILSERAGGDQKAYEQIMASAGEVEPYKSIGVPVQVEGWTGDCYRK